MKMPDFKNLLKPATNPEFDPNGYPWTGPEWSDQSKSALQWVCDTLATAPYLESPPNDKRKRDYSFELIEATAQMSEADDEQSAARQSDNYYWLQYTKRSRASGKLLQSLSVPLKPAASPTSHVPA
jgi:hypothetical protein